MVTITATDVVTADTISAAITLLPTPITVAVSPASVTLSGGQNQAFSAVVTGSSNTAVTWSTSLGTINSSGVYTAPMVSAATSGTVTATSAANNAIKATASIKVNPQTGVTFTTYGNGLKPLFFNGVNYNYLYGENLVTNVTTTTANGSVYVNPKGCTETFNVTTVTQHCTTTGSDSVNVSVTFSAPAAAPATTTAPGTNFGTLQADIQFTNNSATDTITQAMLSIMGVSIAQYNAAVSLASGINETNPIAYVNYQNGQFVIWANTVNPVDRHEPGLRLVLYLQKSAAAQQYSHPAKP